jgi:hypothetical protein
MSKKIGNPEINSNHAEPSFDTSNHDFKESTNLSFDESNNQILSMLWLLNLEIQR